MRFFRWAVFYAALRAAWPLYTPVLGIVLALALAWAGLRHAGTAQRGDGWRYAGTWLQVFGLFFGWRGLCKLREYFGQTPLRGVVATWLRQFRSAFGRPKPVVVGVGGAACASAVGFVGVVGTRPNATTLPERLAAAEARITELQVDQDQLREKLLSLSSNVTQAIQNESRLRETEDAKVSRDVEVVGVGGFPVAFVGLVWLLLGVVCTSISSELAALFGVG